MIKNVVFDVGNVLADFRYRDYMRDIGFSEEKVSFYSDNMVNSVIWNMLDKGDMTEAEAEEHYIKLYPEDENLLRLFWKEIADIIAEYPYSEPLVKALKDKGYKVYALSNYPDRMSDIHWPNFKFLKHMDGYIISAKEHMVKPSEEMYRLLEKRYGIDLKESLFVDDRPVNTEAAKKLGMEICDFTGIEKLISDMEKLGIDIHCLQNDTSKD